MIHHPHIQLTHEQQDCLVARARAGEKAAKDDIILSLFPRLQAMASKFIFTHFHNKHSVECGDLANQASITVIEIFDVALTKEDPYAYLMKAAKRTMIEYYLHGDADTIRTCHQYQDPIPVLSLDTQLEASETFCAALQTAELRLEVPPTPEEIYADLYKAIETLPEKQRAIIRRCYTLGLGDTPITLNEMSRLLSPKSPRPANAHYYNKTALSALRTLLTPASAAYCVGGAKC
ncbi:RNA polymerase sigma factor [Dictyobacter arantiisoli]|uniref:Uncharacterized protein n=1 Tax=Dictyobacter arantiisoli TaxID=2014874 RepID=A0A5A5T8T9_9CHLR|nr:sigma-70 family RNA polymerase sigma factor [Dictyobacter arantiisoli]GCF07324.1 hypothetical protein KDI_08880 [Dictyobacter arantiisoli]